MKKLFFLLIIVLVLGYVVIQQIPEFYNDHIRKEDDQAQEGNSLKNGLTIKIAKDQIYKGDLLLVNKEYPLHQEDLQPDIVNLFQHKELVIGYVVLDKTIRLSERVA